jgi:gag-polypeptide of LTR copia-type/Zinc knuckle
MLGLGLSEKSFKTVAFDGTRDGYHIWEFKMRAFLRELGCADALDRSDLSAAVTDTNERKKNDMAYSRIAMAMGMEDIVSSNLIKRATSSVYPDGDATLAWNALSDRYAPKKAVDRQTLVTELFATTLDEGKDPEVWIIELQRMQSKLAEMGESVSDGLLMAHILGHLPAEYDNVADNLANQDNKTIISVTVSLKDKYERMKKAGKTDSTSETVLLGYKKFSGKCRYCGKQGHKAADCFKKRDDEKNHNGDKNKNSSEKIKKGFQGTCHHCGKKGHKKRLIAFN